MPRLTRRDYEKLLEFRVALRRFQRWSEDQARATGLTHAQHQLLVAIKGQRGGTAAHHRRPRGLAAAAAAQHR